MTMESRFSSSDIVNGAEVFTSDGKKLGTVKEVSSDQFKIDAPMKPDYWLDCNTIETCTTQAVTINLPSDAVDDVKIKR
jgi:hypothetical protein